MKNTSERIQIMETSIIDDIEAAKRANSIPVIRSEWPGRSEASQLSRDIATLERRADYIASRAANLPAGIARQRDESECGAILRILARVRDGLPRNTRRVEG